jgi:hypothetical protein
MRSCQDWTMEDREQNNEGARMSKRERKRNKCRKKRK